MKYGYARVSTDGQSIDAQVRQLKAGPANLRCNRALGGPFGPGRTSKDLL